MNKPWDNEPTPITDRKILNSGGMWNFGLRDAMQDMERRLAYEIKESQQIKHKLFLAEERLRQEGILDYGN